MQGAIRLLPWGPAPPSADAPAPWGLDWEHDLAHGKVITDAVQGDIHLNRLEVRLLSSAAGQRLRRVMQLGMTYLVYPSATHTRFTHSLGAVKEAHRFVDALANNAIRWSRERDHFPHLLTEWNEKERNTRIAEACVLARLGALLHDIAHVPFGHTLEDDLQILESHDEGYERYEYLVASLGVDWPRILQMTSAAPPRPGRLATLGDEVERLILSKSQTHTADARALSNYPFVEDIVGNTICADLLDYLRRDHLFTGLPLDLGRRFLDAFYVSSSRPTDSETGHGERMVCRVVRGARPRIDISTELLKHLRYRYELTERVLAHHAKLAADATLGHLFDYWQATYALEAADTAPELDLDLVESDSLLPIRTLLVESSPERDEAIADRLLADAGKRIEAMVRWQSDFGLLDHLARLDIEDAGDGLAASARHTTSTLARRILDRDLPKRIGESDLPGQQARQRAYKVFGGGVEGTSRRRALEARIAAVLELPGLPVLLWVPNPKMSLKPANVLVDDGRRVEPLVDQDTAAKEIEKHHQDLWRITVFAWPDQLQPDDQLRRQIALAMISDATHVQMYRQDGQRATPGLTDVVARHVADYVDIDAGELLAHAPVATKAEGRRETFSGACEAALRGARDAGMTTRDSPEDWWIA